MRHHLRVGSVALVLALGACSDGDGDSEARQELVDAFTLTADESGGMSAEDRACVAESQVDAIGVEGFEDAGVTPEEIDEAGTTSMVGLGLDPGEEEGQAFYEKLSECIDVRALFLTGIAGGAEVPEAARTCLEENVGDDVVQDFVVTSFMSGEPGSSDVETQLTEAITTCSEQMTGTTLP